MTENASDAVERAAVGDPSKMDMLPGGINIVGVLANEAGVLIVHTLRHDHQIQILIVRIERWKRPIGDPRFQKVADIAVGADAGASTGSIAGTALAVAVDRIIIDSFLENSERTSIES